MGDSDCRCRGEQVGTLRFLCLLSPLPPTCVHSFSSSSANVISPSSSPSVSTQVPPALTILTELGLSDTWRAISSPSPPSLSTPTSSSSMAMPRPWSCCSLAMSSLVGDAGVPGSDAGDPVRLPPCPSSSVMAKAAIIAIRSFSFSLPFPLPFPLSSLSFSEEAPLSSFLLSALSGIDRAATADDDVASPPRLPLSNLSLGFRSASSRWQCCSRPLLDIDP